MGTLLIGVVVWLIAVLGSLKKGEKFWSFQTMIITAFLAAGFVAAFVVSPHASKDSSSRDAAIAGLGTAVGLVYCITCSTRIQEKMRFPLATGLSSLLVGIGFCSIFADLVKWLNSVA
jgi:hypothetical protein